MGLGAGLVALTIGLLLTRLGNRPA